MQEGYLQYLLDYLSHQQDASSLLDLTRIGAAGHSRGGKLAALHLAGKRVCKHHAVILCCVAVLDWHSDEKPFL